jgi:hypothetical protein
MSEQTPNSSARPSKVADWVYNPPHRIEDLCSRLLGLLLEKAINCSCLSIEVFLRQGNFGQRYLTPDAVFIVTAWVVSAYQATGWTALLLYGIAFKGFSLWHFYGMYKKIREGEHIHSYYDGAPWTWWWALPWPFRLYEHQVKRFCEPILCLSAAIILGSLAPGASVALLVTAAFLAFKANVAYLFQRELILDRLDQVVANEHLSEAILELKDPKDLRGAPISGPHPVTRAARERLLGTLLAGAAPQAAAQSREGPETAAPVNGVSEAVQRAQPPASPAGEGVRFACPECGCMVQGNRALAGKVKACPGCKSSIRVPWPGPGEAGPGTDAEASQGAGAAEE